MANERSSYFFLACIFKRTTQKRSANNTSWLPLRLSKFLFVCELLNVVWDSLPLKSICGNFYIERVSLWLEFLNVIWDSSSQQSIFDNTSNHTEWHDKVFLKCEFLQLVQDKKKGIKLVVVKPQIGQLSIRLVWDSGTFYSHLIWSACLMCQSNSHVWLKCDALIW